MKNFDIRDLLIHILHGGIVLFAVLVTGCGFDIIKDVLFTNGNALIVTLCIIISYLIGLVIDPIADCIDTHFVNSKHWIRRCKMRYSPSYDLLKDGECCGLTLAYNVKIRKILNDDVLANQNDRVGTKETITEANEKEIWRNEEDAMLLFNYAKCRVSAYGTPYQLEKIETYFRLFIFYRNMIATGCLSLLILLFAKDLSYWRFPVITAAIPLLAFLLNKISYKYRTYYCRRVLEAVYSPKEPHEITIITKIQ
ncbi:MAG: hypothetical protein LBR52_05010 [Prevotellaceae bacterium]|jgi:hypothetical protein|nr:hypothetical protein [Prevotellaceae bacterium]